MSNDSVKVESKSDDENSLKIETEQRKEVIGKEESRAQVTVRVSSFRLLHHRLSFLVRLDIKESKNEITVQHLVITKSVVEGVKDWINTHYSSIAVNNRSHVEIELKFGQIVDKYTRVRLYGGMRDSRIVRKSWHFHFQMEVDDSAFEKAKEFLIHLQKESNEKFKSSIHDSTDSMYQLPEKRVTVSKDSSGKLEYISKNRISDLYIVNPSSKYDFRLSMSLKLPLEKTIDVSGSIPEYERIKRRRTWVQKDLEFELTTVTTPRQYRGPYDTKATISECEMVLYPAIVFRIFDKPNGAFREGVDDLVTSMSKVKIDAGHEGAQSPEQLEVLVDKFMRNARLLNDVMSD
ncbi:uncharacterized protein J8A68_003678 [[Candida] subhashii]|uniref:mRNA-capping enzyme subunit beta n=1 Tax=[Candida] subhashii TaxID=561895 RepID=A0A8J5UH05_9ASCO|nr:uncharacterized protein J8A68_003678 [[Candida] subhashii]KAG7662823.1 hypothetical protein J8A68_003678 [[Candida] subhashii]